VRCARRLPGPPAGRPAGWGVTVRPAHPRFPDRPMTSTGFSQPPSVDRSPRRIGRPAVRPMCSSASPP